MLFIDRQPRGGIAACTWALAGSLQELGFDVTLVSPPREELPEVGAQVRVDEWLPGIPKSNRRIAILSRLAVLFVVTVLAVLRRAPSVVVLVIVDVGSMDGIIVRFLRFLRRRVVVLAHNVMRHDQTGPLDRRSTEAFRRADHVVVLSHAEERRLIAQVPETRGTVEVIPHGEFHFLARERPDQTEARAELGIGGDSPVLLFFGRIQPYKGVELLLESLAILDERGDDLVCLIAGEAEEATERRLHHKIADLHLTREVRVELGYIPHADVANYFRAADVVVLPYRSATQSGVILLAYGYGRPVVVTDVGGLAEYVDAGTTGEVATPGDPRSLADAITRIVGDRAGLTERQHALETAPPGRFEWSNLAERFAELLS